MNTYCSSINSPMLRSLLMNMLREQAIEAVQRKAAERADAEELQQEQELPKPDVGLIFALGIEAGCTEDLLEDAVTVAGPEVATRHGLLQSTQVAVMTSGSGQERAAKAARLLIEAHRPRYVISAGFAGGLVDSVSRNHVVMVERVVNESGDSVSLDLQVDRASLDALPNVHAGTLLTVDRVIHSPEEKRRLGEEHGTAIVDMETYAVAKTCASLNTPLLAVRIVLDGVDDRLPTDLEPLMEMDGKGLLFKAGAVSSTIFKRPSSVKDMYRLKEDALVTADHLARFLASMVEQLPS